MPQSLVLVSVGNTRTRFAPVLGEGPQARLEPSQVLVNDDPAAIAAAIAAEIEKLETADHEPAAVIASVNHPAAEQVEAALRDAGVKVLRFGRDLEIPALHTLDDASTVGQDRLLDALGAYARSTQACIVIDAGTAVTVDFVDGQGVFHGGAIAPGVHMMLRALHEQTAALPLVTLTREMLPPAPAIDIEDEDSNIVTAPPAPPFGKDTAHAIAYGVASAVRGLVHELIDRYAEFYKAYPRVVATGGDAPLLFESDPLIEAIVPDLTLIGMLEAIQRLEKLDEHAGD
jgi:type III pantothenate kinase